MIEQVKQLYILYLVQGAEVKFSQDVVLRISAHGWGCVHLKLDVDKV